MDKNLYESPEWDRLELEYYEYERYEVMECPECWEYSRGEDKCPFCGCELY